MKRRRNRLVPIFSLPDELLCRIFLEVASTSSLFDLKRIKTLYVCHRWRNVALHYQPLWSFIEYSDYRGDKAWQLNRSGVAPLTVKCTLLNHFSPITLRQLARHADRLQSVEIQGKAVYVVPFMASLAKFRLPLLHTIKVKPYSTQDLPDNETLYLPNTLFTGRAPNLRSLTVRDACIKWELLGNLQSISLSRFSDEGPPISLPSFPTFLSALERCPSLKSLKLIFHLPRKLSAEDFHPLVELPLLQTLNLAASVKDCTSLLTNIFIPPTTSIMLSMQGIFSGSDVRDVLVPLRKHYRAPSASVIRQIGISSTETHLTIESFTDTANRHRLLHCDSYCSVSSHPQNEPSRRKILVKVLKALPVGFVTHLDAQQASLLSDTSWKVVLELLPAVEAIYLRTDVATENLGIALLRMMNSPGSNFPRLRHLYLDPRCFGSDTTDVQQRTIHTLRRLLSRYKELDASVQVLDVVYDPTFSSLLYEGDTMKFFFAQVETFFHDGYVYDPIEIEESRAKHRRKMIEMGLMDEEGNLVRHDLDTDSEGTEA